MSEAKGGETRKARPFAFVASTLHGRQVKRLRLRLAALRPEAEPFFWVAEVHAPELSDEEAKKTPLDIVDACLDAIDAAERVILLTGPTLGSAVKIGDRALASSYTELELFYAVTTGKPVHVFRLDGERADGAIERMLDALGGAAPVVSGSESALLDAARRLAANGRRGRTKVDRSAALNAALAEARHRDFAGLPLFREMEFLGGRALEIDGRISGDLDLARHCLDDLARQTRTERRMSRAWLALRVLMGRHYNEVGDDAALALWDEALREWSRFAGWRGLHAHLRLGHVAALGSLTQVRRRRGSLAAEAETPGHGGDLHGAFGSVYYSLAKRSAGRSGGLFMARSLDYLDSGIAGAPPARLWGLLSTRGSVRAHLRAPGAVEDLARALEIADALDASDGTLAQLTVDLGWAEHGAGARRVGRRRIEDGLELMRRAGEAAGPGFRARSLRKAAFVRLRAGRIAAGARALMEADDVIRAFGAPDQEDRAIRVVRALRRRFGRWVE